MIAARGQTTLLDALSARLKGDVVIVGMGNPLLGDDAAGCLVAQGLEGTRGLHVILAEETPENCFCKILDAEPDVVVFVDAVALGAPPGSVAMLEAEALARYEPSTHRVPLGLVAEFVQRESGADVFVLGIQPRQVTLGSGLSTEVAVATESLLELFRRSTPDSDICCVPSTSVGLGTR